VHFKEDNQNWSDWQSYNTYKPWTLTSNDGTKTVYVQFKDPAGNVSTYSDTIILDTTPPTIPTAKVISDETYLTPGVVKIYGSDQVITFEATDSLSGVSDYYYECSSSVPPTNDVTKYSSQGSSITASAYDGYCVHYYFKARAWDAAGNKSEVGGVWEVIIDKERPTVFISSPKSLSSTYVRGAVNLIGTVDDSNFKQYQLFYLPKGQPLGNKIAFSEIKTSTVKNGSLGRMAPLAPGIPLACRMENIISSFVLRIPLATQEPLVTETQTTILFQPTMSLM